MNDDAILKWLDSDEGQEWLNNRHTLIAWSHGLWATFKPIYPRWDSPAYMYASCPLTEDELDQWEKGEAWLDEDSTFYTRDEDYKRVVVSECPHTCSPRDIYQDTGIEGSDNSSEFSSLASTLSGAGYLVSWHLAGF